MPSAATPRVLSCPPVSRALQCICAGQTAFAHVRGTTEAPSQTGSSPVSPTTETPCSARGFFTSCATSLRRRAAHVGHDAVVDLRELAVDRLLALAVLPVQALDELVRGMPAHVVRVVAVAQ